MKITKDYFNEFSKDLSKLDDEGFISRFNREVGIPTFGVARQGYLWAIREELQKRKIDFSSVGDDKVMSYANVVFLRNNKLFRFSELDKEDANNEFQKYMRENHSEKMQFNPKIIDYDDEQIRFGMQKHQGVLVMETNNIAKKTTGNNV